MKVNSKTIAFIALMGALGNILFIISYHLGPIIPGAVTIDLSHVPTFIAAIYGGPLIGLLTSLIVGIFPGIYYGPFGQGSWLGLIGLPVGKALAGLTAGLLYKALRVSQRDHKSLLTIPLVLISYIPECIFTVLYFILFLPYFIGSGGIGILIFVLPKAWAEIIFISFFMAALIGNNGFNSFIANFFAAPTPPLRSKNRKSITAETAS